MEACLRTLGHYNIVVKGRRRVGSLDPNTIDFITMLEIENRRAIKLKEEADATEVWLEAAYRECLGAESDIQELGLYHGYTLDTGLFN